MITQDYLSSCLRFGIMNVAADVWVFEFGFFKKNYSVLLYSKQSMVHNNKLAY